MQNSWRKNVERVNNENKARLIQITKVYNALQRVEVMET